MLKYLQFYIRFKIHGFFQFICIVPVADRVSRGVCVEKCWIIMKQKSLKIYLDEVCDMLDTYGGRDKVI